MSKKQLLNRLDGLFTELKQANAQPDEAGAEVAQILPIEDGEAAGQQRIRTEPDTSPKSPKPNPLHHRRGEPLGYLARDGRTLTASEELTSIGQESIQTQHLLYQNARGDEPAVVALPVSYEDGVAGLLLEIMDEQPDRRWSEDELLLLEQVADQLSLALESAEYFKRTQSQAEELNILRQVSLELAQEQRELNSVLEIISRRARELLESDGSVLWLWNPETQVLERATVYPPENAPSLATQIKSGEGLAGLAFSRHKTQVIDDLDAWAEQKEITDMPHPPGAHTHAMAVPFYWQNQGVGVLALSRSKAGLKFIPNERHLAELLAAQAASVIQNAHLFESTQAALQETEMLYRASAELNACSGFNQILDILRRYTVLGEQNREVAINLFDRPWTEQIMPDWYDQLACWPEPTKNNLPTTRFPISTIPSAAQLLRVSGPTVISDVEAEPRIGAMAREMFLNKFKARSLLYVPLVAGGQWIGHISAVSGSPAHFSEPSLRRLNAMVAQAAVDIQNLRLLEESRRRAEELQTAAEIARDSTGTLALDDLLTRAVELIRERFGYYQATIFLLDETRTEAVVHASTGSAGREMKAIGHKLLVGSNSVVGFVTRVGEPLVVNEALQDPIYRPNPLLPETRAELGIPLKIGDRVTGALDVQSSRVNAFTPADISVLQILADQLAIAVENARAFGLSIQAVEEMRKADQLKSQFLANMSHELRTPLNSIIGFSRVILKGIDGPITDVQEQDLKAIYNSGQHLLSLINDILDLSKIEAGKMELAFEDHVNAAEVIQSVLSTASGLVKDKPIEIRHEIVADLPPVRADPVKIRQVLLNLLSNAAKFTDAGTIVITANQNDSPSGKPEVWIKVTDTGPGIAREDQSKLFLPFSQVDASPARKTGGSGLGLSICRRLIDLHGGRIWVDSELGEGSAFTFTLPVSAPAPISTTTPVEGGDEATQKPVLSIDDEVEVLNLYRRYLEGHGYQVIPLEEPAKAVQRAAEIRPLAITLDINMPEKDGWQVLDALKKDPATRGIPVIICSITEEQEKGHELGAAGYLLKPILEEDLLGAIRHLERADKGQDV
jgi:signal transduction histidine kinase/ActR/RegA family two-component response regulator